MAGPNYTVIPNDWPNLEYIISDLSHRIIDEDRSLTEYILKDGSRPFTGEQSMGTHKLTDVVDPTADQDAATKKYIADTSQPLDADLTALAALSSTGILTRTAANTYALRTIIGTSNQVNVNNGDGVSGNPTLSTPQNIHTGASPTFAGLTISGLTAERLVATDASKNLVSSDLYSWVAETDNQVLVTNDADGTITLSTPQDIDTGATPTFGGLTINGEAAVSGLAVDTNVLVANILGATDRVGIGTAEPSALLHALSSAAASADGQEVLRFAARLSSVVGSGGYISFYDYADAYEGVRIRAEVPYVGAVDLTIATGYPGDMIERMRIGTDGFISIDKTLRAASLVGEDSGDWITNGDMTSATGWTLEDNWTISGGTLNWTEVTEADNDAYQKYILAKETTYLATFDVTAFDDTDGSGYSLVALPSGRSLYSITGTGTDIEVIFTTAASNETHIGFCAAAGGEAESDIISIDNFSLIIPYVGIFGDGGTTNYSRFDNEGRLVLKGTARVKKGEWLAFNALKAPGTKPATFKDWGAILGVWEFSDADDDTVVFNVRIPPDMDRTVAPSLLIGWSTNTAVTSETAVWQLEYLYTSPGEDTTAAAQETLTVNSDAVAQANGLILAEITGIDLPSATDVCIHCRLKRLGADASDDLTDTAELHGVCFYYTSDKLGEAI